MARMTSADIIDRMIELEFPPSDGNLNADQWQLRWKSTSSMSFTVSVVQNGGWELHVGPSFVKVESVNNQTILLTRKGRIGTPVATEAELSVFGLERVIDDLELREVGLTADTCVLQAVCFRLMEVVADVANDSQPLDARAVIEEKALDKGQRVANLGFLEAAMLLIPTEHAAPGTPQHTFFKAVAPSMGIAFESGAQTDRLIYYCGKTFTLTLLKQGFTLSHKAVEGDDLEVTFKLQGDVLLVSSSFADGEIRLNADDVAKGGWKFVLKRWNYSQDKPLTPALIIRCGFERLQFALKEVAQAAA